MRRGREERERGRGREGKRKRKEMEKEKKNKGERKRGKEREKGISRRWISWRRPRPDEHVRLSAARSTLSGTRERKGWDDDYFRCRIGGNSFEESGFRTKGIQGEF
jgi:hypothetical protein